MDLKTKAAISVLRCDDDLYQHTRNPRYVWHAWQVARQMDLPLSDWILAFIDGLAASEIARRKRSTTTADSYEAALTAMDVAVEAHTRRLAIRKVGKQMGVNVPIARRDRPNLTAIARTAAKANGISVNRLLERYELG